MGLVRFPVRLYPFLSAVCAEPRSVRSSSIRVSRSAGRWCCGKGISTSAIAERVDAGESVEEIAADYDLGPAEIEQAIVYERAA